MKKSVLSHTHTDDTRAVYIWLLIVAASVFLMALIGAITRLTESGLSIVEWAPVRGALPPLNDADWQREFALYQTSPQYQKINAGMSLADFKSIYFWEWIHRLWGRLIGIIYALPLAIFWMKGKLPASQKPMLLFILLLGGLQGGMGWYMVQSGLIDMPAVSHYRLAAHLGLAFLLYALVLMTALRIHVKPVEGAASLSPLRSAAVLSLVFFCITFIWGAFTAGLDAGLIYDSFPLMGAYPWPAELLHQSPVWKNFVENHASVQFTHRLLATVTLLSIVRLWWKARFFHARPAFKRLVTLTLTAIGFQYALGIATVMTGVNIVIATFHQGGALVVLSCLIMLLHHIPPTGYSYDRTRRDL